MIDFLLLAVFLYWLFCFLRWSFRHIKNWKSKKRQKAEINRKNALIAAEQEKKARLEQEIAASSEFQTCLARMIEINALLSRLGESIPPTIEESGKAFILFRSTVLNVPRAAVDRARTTSKSSKDYQLNIDSCMLHIFGSQWEAARAKELLGDDYFLEDLHMCEYESDKASLVDYKFVRKFHCAVPAKFSERTCSLSVSTLYLRELEKKGCHVFYSRVLPH